MDISRVFEKNSDWPSEKNSRKTRSENKKNDIPGDFYKRERKMKSRQEIVSKIRAHHVKNQAPVKKTKGQIHQAEDTNRLKENDPKNPLTSSKLKSALQKGIVNFSEKERSILEKILNKE